MKVENIIEINPYTYYRLKQNKDAIIHKYCKNCNQTFYKPFYPLYSTDPNIFKNIEKAYECDCKENSFIVEELILDGFKYIIKRD